MDFSNRAYRIAIEHSIQKVIFGNFLIIFLFENFLNTLLNNFSTKLKHHLDLQKTSQYLIDKTHPLLSALASSSLKHGAIWKYLSNPETIISCLN